MKIFAVREKTASAPNRSAISGLIGKYHNLVGRRWANWMTRRTQNFSHRSWIILLIVFVSTTGSYCFYLSLGGFANSTSDSVKIERIKRPKNAARVGDMNKPLIEIPAAEYNRIRQFRIYMDSLAKSPAGKLQYDNITRHRPGLMDSIRFIENYYQQSK